MPRRTPIKELQSEDVVSSPLRRSSRLSNSSPVPTKVVTRRNSATDTTASTPKATRGRRASFSQEQESIDDVDKKNTKVSSTPRTRRASLSQNNESKEEEGTVPKSRTRGSSVPKDQAADVKKPTTRRRRSVSEDGERVDEGESSKKITRSRSNSITKKTDSLDAKSSTNSEDTETVNPPVKKSPPEHITILESIEEVTKETDSPPAAESKTSASKQKKLEVVKVDLNLSVINETSLTEEDNTPQEENTISLQTAEKTVTVKDVTTSNEIQKTETEVTSITKSTAEVEKETLAKETEIEKTSLPENNKITNENPSEREKSDTSTVLKENPPTEENDAEISDESLSETSFHLQFSSSVSETSAQNETGENVSPTSNKENVRPVKKLPVKEAEIEPMDVDESLSEISSPQKSNKRKSKTVKIDDVGEELEIAVKATDEIASFLTQEIKFISGRDKTEKKSLNIENKQRIDHQNGEDNDDDNAEVTEEGKKQIETVASEANLSLEIETEVQENTEEMDETPSEEKATKSEVTIEEQAETNEKMINVTSQLETPVKNVLEKILDDKINEPESPEVAVKTPEDKEDISDLHPEEVEENVDDKCQEKELSEENVDDECLEKELDEEKNPNKTESPELSSRQLESPTTSENLSNSMAADTSDQTEKCKDISDRSKSEEGISCTSTAAVVEIHKPEDKSSLVTEEEEEDLVTAAPESPRAAVENSQEIKEEVQNSTTTTQEQSKAQIIDEDKMSLVNSLPEQSEKIEQSPTKATADSVVVEYSKEKSESPEMKKTIEEIAALKSTDSQQITEIEPNEADMDRESEEDKDNLDKDGEECISLEEADDTETNETINLTEPEVSPIVSMNSSKEENGEDNLSCGRRSITDNEAVANKIQDEEKINNPEELTDSAINSERVESETNKPEEVVIISDNEGETVYQISPESENEDKQDTQDSEDKMAANNTLTDSLRRRSSFSMQENVKAGDTEMGLRDQIHKVVDLFCAGIKNKDVTLNVSLEYTGQFSDDSADEKTEKNDLVEVSLAAKDQRVEKSSQTNRGSKRRKVDRPTDASETKEEEIQNRQQVKGTSPQKTKDETEIFVSEPKNKRKKRKSLSVEFEDNITTTPEDVSKEKIDVSPNKKPKKHPDTPFKISKNKREVSTPTEENDEIEEEDERPQETTSDEEVIPQKGIKKNTSNLESSSEDSETQEETETSAKSFSSVFRSIVEDSDENDVTWAPTEDLDSSDTSAHELTCSILDEELNILEEELSDFISKTDKHDDRKFKNLRLRNSSEASADTSKDESAGKKSSNKEKRKRKIFHQSDYDISKAMKLDLSEAFHETSFEKEQKTDLKHKKKNKSSKTNKVADGNEKLRKKTKKHTLDTNVPEISGKHAKQTNTKKKGDRNRHLTYTLSENEKIADKKEAVKKTTKKIPKSSQPTNEPEVDTSFFKPSLKPRKKKAIALTVKPSTKMTSSEWEVKILS